MTGRLSSQRLLDKLSEAACSRSRSPQGLPESNRDILDELSQLLPISNEHRRKSRSHQHTKTP